MHYHVRKEKKGQGASNIDMDPGSHEDESEGHCRTCQVLVHVVSPVATIILLIGLFCALGFLAEVNRTSKASESELVDGLMQCQRQRDDLDLMLHTVTRDSRYKLCPAGWSWWRGRCLFFSVGLQENRQWNESAEFCRQHNSSLAVIKDAAEMDFIQAVMRKFSQVPFLWVGLTDALQESQWLWLDGSDLQHYMPSLIVEWDSDHRDCADLRGGGRFFAARCDASGPWLCKRDS